MTEKTLQTVQPEHLSLSMKLALRLFLNREQVIRPNLLHVSHPATIEALIRRRLLIEAKPLFNGFNSPIRVYTLTLKGRDTLQGKQDAELEEVQVTHV